MGRLVAGAAVAATLGAITILSACHLADTPDAIKCPAGEHADLGKCVQDDTASTLITIGLDDAGACAVSPDVISVTTTGQFQIKNDDNVEHVVMGTDGQTWAAVPAHQSSAFIAITKPGHWDFDVSGCAKGGTVSVQ